MKDLSRKKKKIMLDFGRLSGDDVSAIAASTLPEDPVEAEEPAQEAAAPEPVKPAEPPKPFEGMYYPLGR